MDRDLIIRIAHRVFPPRTEIGWNPAEVAPDCRFWVVSGSQGPRWIIPCDPGHGRLFLSQWRPFKAGSRLKWWTLMAAYRRDQLGHLPGVMPLGVTGHNDQSWDHLGWSGPKRPVPVIYIGTPGPARKVVVGLIDTEKCCLAAVGKIPLGSRAHRSIVREAEILCRLEMEKPSVAPRPLYVDTETGTAVQEAIEGDPTARRLTRTHIAWLLELTVPGETISLREETESLVRQVGELNAVDRGTREVLNRVVSEVDDSTPLPATWVHGDFAPWNLKQTSNRTLRAIDWEYASPRGLPLFDLVYFWSMQEFLFKENRTFSRSMPILLRQYMDGMGIDPGMAGKITLTCLAQHWLRCHQEGDHHFASFLLRRLGAQLAQAR